MGRISPDSVVSWNKQGHQDRINNQKEIIQRKIISQLTLPKMTSQGNFYIEIEAKGKTESILRNTPF